MANELTRREMLGRTAGAAATALAGSHWVFQAGPDGSITKVAAAASDWKPLVFSSKEGEQLARLCETIIPETDTAGARTARVHEYIDVALSIGSQGNRDRFKEQLKWMDKYCKKTQKVAIHKASPEQLIALLDPLSDEHESHPEELKTGASFFRDLKSKTIFGYYTSKEGRVQELGLPEHTMMTTFDGCTHGGEH
jgi:glucoside 3-dehydrogenase (cytochrome c) hitch-hiker subunit